MNNGNFGSSTVAATHQKKKPSMTKQQSPRPPKRDNRKCDQIAQFSLSDHFFFPSSFVLRFSGIQHSHRRHIYVQNETKNQHYTIILLLFDVRFGKQQLNRAHSIRNYRRQFN